MTPEELAKIDEYPNKTPGADVEDRLLPSFEIVRYWCGKHFGLAVGSEPPVNTPRELKAMMAQHLEACESRKTRKRTWRRTLMYFDGLIE